MSTKKDILWRIGLAYLCLVLFGIAIAWKVFYIQNFQGNYYRAMADSVVMNYATVEAERGNIYSADGRLLATSLPSFDLHWDLQADGLTKEIFNTGAVDSLSAAMASFFGDKSASDYKKQFLSARQRGDRYFLVKKDLTYPQLKTLKKFPIFRFGQFKGGIIITKNNERYYPYKELANRTIGYLRDESVKPIGLEASFNHFLTGVPGRRLEQKVSGGDFVPVNDENELDPQHGKDVITTIDINLQDVAEHALMKTLIANKADHGCVVVMDVKTGAIKAIANLGRNEKGNYWEAYNYAIGESHEPGSTFKLASMLALLDDGYINIQDHVDVELGIHQYWNQTMRDAEKHNLRDITIKEAFAHSSNVGISKLVYQHYNKEPEKYLQHLRDLGLDKKLNIEIPGEHSPYLKNTTDALWTKYSLPWMAVGYEVQISPLQLLTMYNAVANNAVMMKPYLVREIREYGKTVEVFEPTVLNLKICSEQTLQSLQELLEEVVDSGTARNLKNSNYSIAGKTGTAQIADAKAGYGKKVYQSSFVGYFPANAPLYSCIVVVNAPSNGVYYGSAVAAPVFKEIADKVYSTNLDLHPAIFADSTTQLVFPLVKSGYEIEIISVLNQLGITNTTKSENPWVKVEYTDSQLMLFDKNVKEQSGVVPDVLGMGIRDALYLLENSGLNVSISGYGTVRTQSILPGTRISEKQTISIALTL